MKQRTLAIVPVERLHIAIVMDGNGRWATARRRPRSAGHVEGARAVRRTVEAARRLGVGALTLHAFSSDNWARPAREVGGLMRLFVRYLAEEREHCVDHGIRVRVLGRRDRFDAALGGEIAATERATRDGSALDLRIALDYSARDAVVGAAARLATRPPGAPVSRAEFARALGAAQHLMDGARDVDLLIRTGGEQRLSDFMLWECAYAELYFTTRMWPDFGHDDLVHALHDFHARERRFGALPAARAL